MHYKRQWKSGLGSQSSINRSGPCSFCTAPIDAGDYHVPICEPSLNLPTHFEGPEPGPFCFRRRIPRLDLSATHRAWSDPDASACTGLRDPLWVAHEHAFPAQYRFRGEQCAGSRRRELSSGREWTRRPPSTSTPLWPPPSRDTFVSARRRRILL